MRRREFFTLLGGAAVAWPPSAYAQRPKRLPKVGWLKIQGRQHRPDRLQAFREGMRALGLIEERDYEIEERYADGAEARLPNLTRPERSRARPVAIMSAWHEVHWPEVTLWLLRVTKGATGDRQI